MNIDSRLRGSIKEKYNEIYIKSNKSIDFILNPYRNRRQTDVIWVVAYAILSIFVMTAFFYTYIAEKDDNLFKPRDPDFNKCGQSAQAKEYPYIYFPAPFIESMTKAVCVKKCPQFSTSQLQCLKNRYVQDCSLDMTDHFNRSNQFIVYPTYENELLAMCQPVSKVLFDSVNQKINTHYLFLSFEKLYESISLIFIGGPIITVILVILFMCMLTKIGPNPKNHHLREQGIIRSSADENQLTQVNCNIKILFFGIPVAFGLLMLAFFIYSFSPSGKRTMVYMPILGVLALIVDFVIIFYFLYYKKYLENSLVLLSIGFKYIKQNPFLIFLSITFFIIFICVVFLQILTLIFLYSIDSDSPPPKSQTLPYNFAYFTAIHNTIFVKVLLCISTVHFIWTLLIVNSLMSYLAMASASFWVCNIKNNFKNALFSLLKFHIGTVIKGALLNIVPGKITALAYLCLPSGNHRCCGCCTCPCLSRCYRTPAFSESIGIYNDLNYVRVAVYGESYSEAGLKISNTIIDYMNDVSKTYILSRAMVFLSKFLVSFIATLLCYAYTEMSPNIRGYFLTNFLIFCISYFLTSLAFESYDRSFEVILLTILIKKSEEENSITGIKKKQLILYDLDSEKNPDTWHKKLEENDVRIWFHEQYEEKDKNNNDQ